MYERYFGLADAPFRLTPDARYLFLSSKHADALAHLRLGLTESSGFVCITGDVGTGKTTLLRTFIEELGSEVATAYIFNPALSALELLQTINAEFGLPSESNSKKVLVDTLNRHLLAQRQAGRLSVVMIDEAQALGIEVLEQLRLLSNLETTTEKLLRIILVGQPQLRELLLHPDMVQLNQRITLRWHIGPLSREESAAYVRHRLRVASDGLAERIFTRPALTLIYRLSGGVPRLINMIAHRAMLAAFAAERRTVSVRYVQRAFREISTVPLPPALRAGRRAALAALVAGVCLGVLALGAGRLAVERSGRNEQPAAAAAPALAAIGGDLDHAPAAMPSAPEDANRAPEPEAGAGATPEPTAAIPAPAPEAAPLAADPANERPAALVEQQLAGVSSAASARAALAAILASWHAAPLGAHEGGSTLDIDRVAAARGFNHLVLSGNGGMLRLLDLPAILELRVPGSDGPRFAAVVGIADNRWMIALGDGAVTVTSAFLERCWFGQAHLLWRDFEQLGAAPLGPSTRGPSVQRLARLLKQAGAYPGPETDIYDTQVSTAVAAFQRARRLGPDGLVGPLTRIVLYDAAGGYARPSLTAALRGAS
jgi:general secretion pathway protein A